MDDPRRDDGRQRQLIELIALSHREHAKKLLIAATPWFAPDEVERFVYELAQHAQRAGEEGITEDEAREALQEATTVITGFMLLEHWREGNLAVGWSAEQQELMFTITDKGNQAVEALLSNK